ncbi:MAG: hypothetical protein J6U54_12510 [Clostridiales bacterium]|nr:hypothetical protein [Clostridiales bacterium]
MSHRSLNKNIIIISTILILSVLLSACSGVKVDERITTDSVHVSSDNACRGFFQSLYEDDSALFEECFYKDALDGEDTDAWEMLRSNVDEDAVFVGTKHIATRPCDEENGLDYDTVHENIAFFNDVDSEVIEDIVLVSVEIFFKVDGKYKSIEIYSIVFKADGGWYFFSPVDVTAKKVKES